MNKKLIWLDDDFLSPALITEQTVLESRGYSITKAKNPDEFYDKCHADDYACIILDISLPLGSKISAGDAKKGMRTGLVVLDEIIKDESLKAIPKVVYTIVTGADVQLFCDEHDILYINKLDALPWTLADELDKLLEQS